MTDDQPVTISNLDRRVTTIRWVIDDDRAQLRGGVVNPARLPELAEVCRDLGISEAVLYVTAEESEALNLRPAAQG